MRRKDKVCLPALIAVLTMLLNPLYVSAQDAAKNCPAIDCACDSLPSESWQQVCASHESKIKQSCVENQNVPRDYCSIHGEGAKPLPLLFDPTMPQAVLVQDIPDHNKKIAALFWSLREDLNIARQSIKDKSFSSTQQVLKMMDENLKNLFRLEKQVAATWIADDDEGEAEDAWDDYSEDNLEVAEAIRTFGEQLMALYADAPAGKDKDAYRILGVKTLRMAGKAYEQTAFSYARADQHDDAARIWKQAADVAKAVLVHKESIGAEQEHIDYYRYQTAARLHRASLHWVLDGEREDAREQLEESSEFMDDQAEITPLLDEEEEASGSGLRLFK